MGVFIKQGSLLPSFRVPSIPTTINVNMFFDKAPVKAALTKLEREGLSKSGMLVRDSARKSIRKMGMAKPKLRVMSQYPGATLNTLLNSFQKGPYKISKRTRDNVRQRIYEVSRRPASAPGTPPHTHVPYSMMLGFRRNLYNGVDLRTKSAVVGPSKKGDDWTIPRLHEFGGSKGLRQWLFVPQHPRYTKPITRWASMREDLSNGWVPTGETKVAQYPARPYMAPALERCRHRISKMFAGRFSAGVARG